MRKVLVVGAGRVGRTIVHMLSTEDEYSVELCDARPEQAAAVVAEVPGAEAFDGDASQPAELKRALEGKDAVISAAPFVANPQIAECAAEAGVNYFDLTEDVQVTRFVKELAESNTGVAFVPQCGVAPGFISLAGVHIIQQFDEVHSLTLRVGALPDQPNNRLKYNLTWSTEGLVNEYIHPCESLRRGEITMVPPLEGKEEVIVDGVTYEAFTTSGGVGTLCHTYEGKIRRLDYKTIRYPGHLELIRFLMDDLRFRENPEELVKIFHRSIPATRDDFTLVSVRGLGTVDGRFEERTYWRKVEGRRLGGHFFTGIEVSTAAGVCGVLHVLLGADNVTGFVKVEDVPFDRFMASPFGRYYGRRY
ncbi:MAG: saccharopine dehydrogenase family protein [Planctomycetota bacterium]|jgi:saccharopine dehydrogenase-like NADP-dependent oxidoreductase